MAGEGSNSGMQLVQVELANELEPEDSKLIDWSSDWPLHLNEIPVASWRGGRLNMLQKREESRNVLPLSWEYEVY